MNGRRKWKNVKSEEGQTRHKALNNHLRRITDRARGHQWEEQCSEREEHKRKVKMDLMYKKVSQLTK